MFIAYIKNIGTIEMNNVEERACNNLGNGFIILSKNSINNSALEYFNSNKIIFL